MRSYFIMTYVLSVFIAFNVSAANVTVRWTGKVPTSGCASKPISNQESLEQLITKCRSELKSESKSTNTDKRKIVSFDV